jgi:electron-transferring-flavoprotein dehydrogenase
VRNIRPAFGWGGLWGGMIYAALEAFVLRGRGPWTIPHRHTDHGATHAAARHKPIAYPKPDGVLTFDRLSSVYLTGTNHVEDQPAHLVLRDPAKAIAVNHAVYASPETRYCPAGVYEIVHDGAGGVPRLQINAQNCIHCKTCDIKDPTQNITWVPPEGGGGPKYGAM